ncbi:hypothetical protein E8E11_004011 [Didymella keratinophila]|nr:hypothetical protein E8E11_004011 [Didymella keratinophila]
MDSNNASTEDIWRHPYVALEPQSRQIRLLHLQPGQLGDPIECRTSIVSFNEEFTDYEALSYVWGERLYYGWISLDGTFFPVTENLWGALSGLRYTDRERVLWIDAICIDQANLRERSEQVSRMYSIFTQASTVIVWLGEEWDMTDLALGFFIMFGLDIKPNVNFPTLQPAESEEDEVDAESATDRSHETNFTSNVGELFGGYEDDKGYDADLEDHADEAYAIDPEDEEDDNKERVFNVDFTMRVKTLTLGPVRGGPEERSRSPPTEPTKGFKGGPTAIDGGPIVKAVKRFMNFPWWTRIWTVQEFVLAGSSVFHCRKYIIDGAVLLHHYQEWEAWFRVSFVERLRIQSGSKPKFEAITNRIATVTWGRVFMVTRTGRIGFIPKDALEDDVIAVLTGGRVPIVLRPKDGYYNVVGDAYVHGIMDGEAIEDCSGELQDLELR